MIKHFGKKLIICIALVLLAGFFAVPEVSAADAGYETERFDVKIDVKEDNSLIVTETIKVNFATARHGVYRTIPIEGKARYKEAGKPAVALDSAMKIDQLKVDGFEYETSEEGGHYVIRIGSPDYTVKGKQTYRLSYRCRMYDDGISDSDIFYYNVIPQGWETRIDQTKITINMPKEFDREKLSVYAGSYGGNQFADRLQTKVRGKQIIIRSTDYLPQAVGVTVQQMLPEGYFKGEMTNNWAYYTAIALSVLAALLCLLLWFCFGRDRRMVKPVEFYPPEDITPAEMGYVIDGKVHKKDIISMLIYFADKGYLSIEESSETGITLRKEASLPDDISPFMYTIMSGIFEDGKKEINLEDMPEDFYETYSAAAYQIKADFTEPKERRLYHRSGNIARMISAFLMIVPLGAGIVFGSIFAKAAEGLFIAMPSCAFVFLAFFCGMILYDRKDGMKRTKYAVLTFLLAIVALLFTALGLIVVWTYLGLWPALLVFACTAACYICTRQMRKLTPYGNQLIGRILGFKEFLAVAELEKINQLAEENPSYFYDILPYAYVFGLSDKWSRKFESIKMEPPVWYSGSYSNVMFNTWVFTRSFDRCTRAMQSDIKITSPDKGGGFSGGFGGGGGFSGGGFGGGGGGAW